MTIMKRLLFYVFVIIIVYPVSGQNHMKSQDLIGNWKLDGDIILEFYQNGNVYNAKIVSCPDQEQEGVEMITNLMDNGKKYSGGSIFDPGNGKTYYCSVIIEGDKLKITGSLDKNGRLGRTMYASRIVSISKYQTEDSQKKSEVSTDRIHVIKCLESLDVISGLYGVSVETIMAINNLKDRKLKVGQKLIIPSQSDLINEDSIDGRQNIDEVTNIPHPQSISAYQKNIVASDVDVNIPTSGKHQESTFAVIIANENYKRESKVDYAINDGEIFAQYCINTLGLPQSNVHCVKDATLNDFRAEMDWLSQISKAYQGEARLIVYYAGHGVPDEDTRSSYLLPIDGYGSNVNTGYKLSDMYMTLSTYPVKSVLVLLDACFSGAQRNGDMLTSSRGVALKAKQEVPKGNMVVMTAASEDETAYKYDEKKHGMFTYFLLKKLQEKGVETTLGELADFIATNVGRRSIVVNMKPQTPTVSASGTLSSQWKSITFKE